MYGYLTTVDWTVYYITHVKEDSYTSPLDDTGIDMESQYDNLQCLLIPPKKHIQTFKRTPHRPTTHLHHNSLKSPGDVRS